jgi:hypothetical protein
MRPRKNPITADSSDQGNTAKEANISSSKLSSGAPGEKTSVPSELRKSNPRMFIFIIYRELSPELFF